MHSFKLIVFRAAILGRIYHSYQFSYWLWHLFGCRHAFTQQTQRLPFDYRKMSFQVVSKTPCFRPVSKDQVKNGAYNMTKERLFLLSTILPHYRAPFISITGKPQVKASKWKLHCVKFVQIRSFFWSVFSRIRTKYGEIRNGDGNWYLIKILTFNIFNI